MLKTQTGFKLLLSVKAISHLNDLNIIPQLGTLSSVTLVKKIQHNFSVIDHTSNKFVYSLFSNTFNAFNALYISSFIFHLSLHMKNADSIMQHIVYQHFIIHALQTNQSFQGESK